MKNRDLQFEIKKKSVIVARALLLCDRLDLRTLGMTSVLSEKPLTISVREGGIAVLFRYGVIILFDVMAIEEASLLEQLKPYLIQPLSKAVVDEVEMRKNPEATEGMSGNVMIVREFNLARLILVADILSKSVILDYYELKVAQSFDAIEPLAKNLYQKGKVGRRVKELLKHIGGSLLSLHTMVGRVEVTEKAEIIWDHPEYERFYARLEDEYEIQERHLSLERKMDLISRTAETILDLLQTKRSLRVEWYIVILIVIEIVIILYDIAVR